MEQLNLQQRSYLLFANGKLYFTKRQAPDVRREESEKPVCKRSERCADCPYPAHGFVCWQDTGRCLRTEMEKITEKEKKIRNERNYLQQRPS